MAEFLLFLVLQLSEPCPAPPLGWTTEAQVVRVIDGDTVVMKIEKTVRVRFADASAPELREPGGDLSKTALVALAKDQPCVLYVPTGQARTLGDVWSFERILGVVWRKGDEKSLGQLQIESGHAQRSR